jgi:photosystem II stability/assembly factor-like uncharacterized protein
VELLEDRTLLSTAIPINDTSWQAIGPAPINPGSNPVSGRVTGIAADPSNPDIVYVATAGGGVWKTTNATSPSPSWTPLTDHLPGLTDAQRILFMGSVALGPKDPATGNYNIVYAGEGEQDAGTYGHGVLKSTDAGTTWTLLGNNVFDRLAIGAIVPDPNNANLVYAGTDAGVWKSTDGGQTWGNAPTLSGFIGSVIMDPSNSKILYAAIDGDSIYKSIDAGVTWVRETAGIPQDFEVDHFTLAISKTNSPQTIYAAVSDSGADRITGMQNKKAGQLYVMLKSTDQGQSWATMSSTPNYMGVYPVAQGPFDSTLAVDPNNANIVYAGGSSNGGSPCVIMTVDGGNNWTNITGSPHTDDHAFAFDANGKLLNGNDGGIWRLQDPQSIQWTDLTGNLAITQFTGIALNPIDANIAYGGSQDNGTEKFNNNLGWKQIVGGDGGFVRIDGGHPQTVYQEGQHSGTSTPPLQKSTDGGATFAAATTGLGSDPGLFYIPYVIDPANDQRLLLGTDHIYETTDGAANWTARAIPGQNGWPKGPTVNNVYEPDIVDWVAAVPANHNYIYASLTLSTGQGTLWISTNDGDTTTTPTQVTSWFQLPSPSSDPFATYDQIITDPANENIVYVISSDFPSDAGGKTIWQSLDAGQHWKALNGPGLPNSPLNSILLDPWTKILYVGTDNGVYESNTYNKPAGQITWQRLGVSLPDARVADLELSTAQLQQNAEGYVLAAGTYGRGVWELNTIHFEAKATDSQGNPLTSIQAGTPFNLTITAKDSFGQPVVGYTGGFTGTVNLSTSDLQAVLPASYTFTTQDNDSHTFQNVVLKTVGAGTQTISFSDPANGGVPPGLLTLNLVAAPASQYKVAIPAASPAGVPFDVTLTALDPYGNVATSYRGSVTISTSDPTGTLPSAGSYTFTTGDAGVHVFSGFVFTHATVGGRPTTITFTDVSNRISTSTSIQITPLGSSRFLVNVPASVAAGSPFTVTVTALDKFNNINTNYAGTITFTSSDSTGSLSAPYTFTSSDAGVHAFTGAFTFTKAGTPTITLTDNSVPPLSATTPAITITPQHANHFQVSLPTTAPAGSPFSMAVTALDPFNNIDTNYAGKVAFSSSDPSATLPAPYTFTVSSPPLPPDPTKDNGQHTFTNAFTFPSAGTPTITLTDNGVPAVTTTTPTITITPLAPKLIALNSTPAAVEGGKGVVLTVAGTNFVPSSLVQINGVPVTTTFVNPTQLTAVIPDASLTSEGTLTVTVNTPAPGGGSASLPFTVADAPLTAQPATLAQLTPALAYKNLTLATFTDTVASEPTSNYSAMIFWGDKTAPTSGTITVSNGTFTVTGNHTFAVPGVYAVVVSIADSGGSTVGATDSMTVGDDNQRYLNQVYQSLFNRTIDTAGLAFFTPELQSGMSRRTVVQQLTHSTEYFTDVVQQLYQQYLGRPADPVGLNIFVSQLQAGVTDAQVTTSLVSSPEFYANSGGSSKRFVDALYAQVLGRPADAGGESFWLQQLSSGLSLNTVARAFVTSVEGQAQVVQGIYHRFLGRPAAGVEVGPLVTALGQGLSDEDLIAALLASDEYIALHA